MTRLCVTFISGLFLVSGLASSAQGLVSAYDSFGPGDEYDGDAALPLMSATPRGGFAFTPGVSGNLRSITLPLASIGGPNFAQIGVYETDPKNGFPATLLELFAANGVIPVWDGKAPAPISFRSSLEPVLEAGNQYWLVVSAQNGAEIEWFGVPERNAVERYYYSDAAGNGAFGQASPPSVFRVTVAAVPEPAAAGLVLIGVALLVCARHKAQS